MRTSSALRAGLIAMTALAGAPSGPPPTPTAAASVSASSKRALYRRIGRLGHPHFSRQTVPLGIGGLSYGFTFGASETHFRGTVSHIGGPGMSPGSMPPETSARRWGGARRPLCSPTSTARCWS